MSWIIYECGGCHERYMVTKHSYYCPYCRMSDISTRINEPPIIKRKIILSELLIKQLDLARNRIVKDLDIIIQTIK